MSEPALTASDAIAWNEFNADTWRKLLSEHPDLLTQPCDIAGASTVAQLLQHIVAVELRYAERLADLPVSDYANLPYDSVETLFATHDRAIAIFRELLTTTINWDESLEFVTRTYGPARSTRKAVLFHALLHGQRHYAQLATLVRQYQVKPPHPGDYLFLYLERV